MSICEYDLEELEAHKRAMSNVTMYKDEELDEVLNMGNILIPHGWSYNVYCNTEDDLKRFVQKLLVDDYLVTSGVICDAYVKDEDEENNTPDTNELFVDGHLFWEEKKKWGKVEYNPFYPRSPVWVEEVEYGARTFETIALTDKYKDVTFPAILVYGHTRHNCFTRLVPVPEQRVFNRTHMIELVKDVE